MPDLPRGWTLTVDVTGVIASITMPGIAGVAHVLDSVSAKLVSAAVGAAGALVLLNSSDGTYINTPLLRMSTLPAPAGSFETDSGSLSGLDMAAGPGASLTVAFSATGAALTELLVIQGHDV